MSLIGLVILIAVAAIAGSIGQALAGYSVGGCIMSIVVGFIGAMLGTWLARLMGLPEFFALRIGGTAFPIVWSVVGGALFAAVLSLLRRPSSV